MESETHYDRLGNQNSTTIPISEKKPQPNEVNISSFNGLADFAVAAIVAKFAKRETHIIMDNPVAKLQIEDIYNCLVKNRVRFRVVFDWPEQKQLKRWIILPGEPRFKKGKKWV